MMPWEQFTQLIIIILIGLAVAVGVLMYLDGYWTAERVDKRRLNANTFSAIDRRHQMKRMQK